MEEKYTRDQIKDAIWQELKDSDYAGENNDRAYEIIGIVMAGIDKIVSGMQPGAAWVKASTFKYIPGAAYHAKDNLSKGAGKFDVYGQFIWGDGTVTLQHAFEALYILDESPAAAKEEDAKPFLGLEFRSRVAPINSYEVVEVFEQSNEFKVKVTQECEVNRTTCYEVWSIDGFVKYYNMGVYFKQQKEK